MTLNIKKSLIKKIIRIGILLLCLSYIIYFFIQNKETLQITFSFGWTTLILIVLLQLIYFLIQSLRFQIVIEKCSGTKLPFWPWTKTFIIGRFLNLVFSQAGNIYRSVRLKKEYGISYTRYVSGFASMAWIDTSMNLIIAIVVIFIFSSSFQIGRFTAWKLLFFFLLAFILMPVFLDIVFRKITFRNSRLLWIHTKLSEALRVTVSSLQDPWFLLKMFGLGILVFIRTVIIFHLYFKIFNVNVPLPALAVFYTLFKLCFFIILTPGNLGVQEVAWGFLSEQMGIGTGQGIMVSGLIRVFSTCTLIVLGLSCGGLDVLRHSKECRSEVLSNEDKT